MCNNYAPVQRQLLRDVYGVEPPPLDYPPETWPDYAAPIIVSNGDGREALVGTFGMVPKSRIPPGVAKFDTTNARSETVGEKRSFSGAWKLGQICLVPATSFFEPNYESGPKSVRWRIWLKGEPEFAIAGLWRAWPREAGAEVFSFTMLTINSDKHPLMNRFHAPGKEKRMIVIVPRAEWDDWLTCRDPERARSFLRPYPPELMDAEPAPRAPRAKAAE
ncbi:SOS response-associated peptidase [Cupriavidus basilensis]|uniref:SOS response-associated peptidase n=1 Tax=Cupriavidus basilensis TaxID=68895 RepID=UPI0023E815B5|nr:SOS response-associated peptidase family protein [Cupriavidus basilensis]MDF3883095.1 SOS response-associated peptidase family protein [Cupriavidus basilensis]